MPDIDKEEQRKIVESAIESWLDKKFAIFGKWTAGGVAAAVFALLCRYLFAHGWHIS